MKLKYLILILFPISVFSQTKTVIPGQVYMPGISGTGSIGVVAIDGKLTKGSVTASDITNFKEQVQDSVGAMVNSTLTYNDATPSLGINLGNANTWTQDISVPDEVYDATAWNGSVEVPTKNALRDKIESLPIPTGAALTKVDDTNVTLTLGGSPTTALVNAASLTLGWTGTLADGRIASSTNWNTAYTDRLKWDGGATGLTASTGRASLGLVIGTDVQAYDADLTTWAGITPGSGIGTWLATPSSANLASALTDETGSGLSVFATSPTLTTPVLGVATATSINKMAITAPATSSTLAVADGKTLTASNTITLTATDATTLNFKGGESINAPYNSVYFYDDFLNISTAETGEIGSEGWSFAASGTGASVSAGTAAPTRPGVIVIATGTTTTGSCVLTLGATWAASGGQTIYTTSVRLPTLSTVGEEYIFRVGLHDGTSGAVTDGVYFEYNRLTAGDFWRCATANNSTRTLVTTTSAIVANTWYRLKIIVNAAGTSVDYYVDDVLLTSGSLPITTNIPTTSARTAAPSSQIIKSAGTTSRTAENDYAEFRQTLTTAR